jgi:hypothetical protein
MKIERTMDLETLREMMGADVATPQEAKRMRGLLVEVWDGTDTDDLPGAEWDWMLDRAADRETAP